MDSWDKGSVIQSFDGFIGDSLNSSAFSGTYMRLRIGSVLAQIMACHLFGPKQSSEPMLGYCQLDP